MPYEEITSSTSLFSAPKNAFFPSKTEFYSDLNQTVVSDEEYENLKFLYLTLRMRNLSYMNDLYNAQNVIIICGIIGEWFEIMYSPYGFNPRKCNSASSLSECIERNLSKVIIELPTNKTIIEIFEKTITGDFSCVNTRLGFDTEILMPNYTTAEYDKMTANQSFKSYK